MEPLTIDEAYILLRLKQGHGLALYRVKGEDAWVWITGNSKRRKFNVLTVASLVKRGVIKEIKRYLVDKKESIWSIDYQLTEA